MSLRPSSAALTKDTFDAALVTPYTWGSDIWNKGLTFLPKGPTESVLCAKGVR